MLNYTRFYFHVSSIILNHVEYNSCGCEGPSNDIRSGLKGVVGLPLLLLTVLLWRTVRDQSQSDDWLVILKHSEVDQALEGSLLGHDFVGSAPDGQVFVIVHVFDRSRPRKPDLEGNKTC